MGSGGTLGGISRLFRERAPHARLVGAVPDRLQCGGASGHTLVEGIVEDLAGCEGQGVGPDEVIAVSECRRRGHDPSPRARGGHPRGRIGGRRSHAAVEVARRLGPGKRVVTLLADTGRNYLSTYFSPAWRERHGIT